MCCCCNCPDGASFRSSQVFTVCLPLSNESPFWHKSFSIFICRWRHCRCLSFVYRDWFDASQIKISSITFVPVYRHKNYIFNKIYLQLLSLLFAIKIWPSLLFMFKNCKILTLHFPSTKITTMEKNNYSRSSKSGKSKVL